MKNQKLSRIRAGMLGGLAVGVAALAVIAILSRFYAMPGERYMWFGTYAFFFGMPTSLLTEIVEFQSMLLTGILLPINWMILGLLMGGLTHALHKDRTE